jgi:hypothetical protein
MAKPSPCQRCLQVPDADFYLTNRLDAPWVFDQATVSLCFECLVESVRMMAQAYAQAVAQLAAEQGPGILAEIDDAERLGAVTETRPKSKSRKESESEPEPEPVAVAEEGQAAHVDS